MTQSTDPQLPAEPAPSRGWRDAVPPLPLRFTIVLSRPDRAVVAKLHQRMAAGEVPDLKLLPGDGRAVLVALSEDDTRVGNVPARDARMLSELGVGADVYTPHVLGIRYDEQGRLDHVDVELVRPTVRYCSACGNPHTGTEVNCEKCRASRRRKGEEAFEQAPINFHESLDSSSRRDEQQDPDF